MPLLRFSLTDLQQSPVPLCLRSFSRWLLTRIHTRTHTYTLGSRFVDIIWQSKAMLHFRSEVAKELKLSVGVASSSTDLPYDHYWSSATSPCCYYMVQPSGYFFCSKGSTLTCILTIRGLTVVLPWEFSHSLNALPAPYLFFVIIYVFGVPSLFWFHQS